MATKTAFIIITVAKKPPIQTIQCYPIMGEKDDFRFLGNRKFMIFFVSLYPSFKVRETVNT